MLQIVSYITGKGAYAIIDPHNFGSHSNLSDSVLLLTTLAGRYYEKVITDVAGFKAWWVTVAKMFADNDLVIFDTNNEYHTMEDSLVFDLNQAAINGIREAGATEQLILVEGNLWTGAWTWVRSQSLSS
jgi:endoglucanase